MTGINPRVRLSPVSAAIRPRQVVRPTSSWGVHGCLSPSERTASLFPSVADSISPLPLNEVYLEQERTINRMIVRSRKVTDGLLGVRLPPGAQEAD